MNYNTNRLYFSMDDLVEMDDKHLDELAAEGHLDFGQVAEIRMERDVVRADSHSEAAQMALLDDHHPHDYLKKQIAQHEAKNEPLALNELQQFLDTSDTVLESLANGGQLSLADLAAIRLMKVQRRDADYNDAAIMALGERYQDHSASERAPEGYADRIMRLAQESGHFEQ